MATIVREVNWAGPCIEQGVLIGETKHFYIVEPTGRNRRRRIKKGSIGMTHVEPCERCMDHPKTAYPNGYEG